MKNLQLKICGMRNLENILEVGELLPDYLGFIFYQDSPRNVTNDFILPQLPVSVRTVAVFVNEPIHSMLEKIKTHQFDFVQLHGNESVETCEELKQNGVSVIKAFSVHDQFSFQSVKKYHGTADYFLFDTKGVYPGGNAQTFNWQMLNQYDQQTPFFLSGGLSVENLKSIKVLADLNIHALDLNSGVERAPGIKDTFKVKQVKNILNTLNKKINQE